MSSITRRFGTDVSNIPSDVLFKTPTKKIIKTPKSNASKASRLPNPSPSPSPLFDVMETLMDTLRISIDDEITITSPIKLTAPHNQQDQIYAREFLLYFKDFCTQPIENLLPEVTPGFAPMELNNSISFSNPTTPMKSSTKSFFDSPVGSERSANLDKSFDSPSGSSKEWRVKKIKKEKPREQDERRLSARQKQIDIGMNTVGYQKFLESMSTLRSKSHPKIPDIHQVCSKRSWDGQVRKWRRQLHDFDPTPAAGEDGLENAADRHATNNSEEEEDLEDDEDSEEEVLEA